jgi:hypothetical protein
MTAAGKIFTEIEITDFKEDPGNDSALAVLCEVRRPGPLADLVCVYFSEDFFEKYFRIPWHKRLPAEEERILREKRDLFVRWALVKIEKALRDGLKEDKITVTYPEDAGWAEKVEKGLIKPHSEPHAPHVFRLY